MSPVLQDRIGGRIATMRLHATLAFAVALATVPAWSQRQVGQSGGYAGSAAHSGGGFHSGAHGAGGAGYARQPAAPSYSGLTGLQAPSGFSQPGRFPMPGLQQQPPRSGSVGNYRGNQLYGAYTNPGDYRGHDPHRGPYRGHDHDRRNRGWGAYGYAPGYVYPYPYVAGPGFYDWGQTDYSENDQGPYAPPPDDGPNYGPQQPPYPASGDAPYPQEQQSAPPPPTTSAAPQRQEYHFASASPSTPSPNASKPLTVIFKGDRAPEKMQNYMVTATALTNLDGDHFEKIPLDQVDVAATQQANRRSGIDFQIPAPSHD
ncbi:hypothetical protein [Occallatibacter savannae]|uniref:hypothetical protein n=1 Tax=Occallatibacter savannae TaxID=1002691 RepID=UPI0013A5B322|nr:hypothetical protein [Occallatibacter savannae]